MKKDEIKERLSELDNQLVHLINKYEGPEDEFFSILCQIDDMIQDLIES